MNIEEYCPDNVCNFKEYISDYVSGIYLSDALTSYEINTYLMKVSICERVIEFISRCEDSVLSHNVIIAFLDEYFAPWEKCKGLEGWWTDEDNPYYESSIAYDIRYATNYTIEVV